MTSLSVVTEIFVTSLSFLKQTEKGVFIGFKAVTAHLRYNRWHSQPVEEHLNPVVYVPTVFY